MQHVVTHTVNPCDIMHAMCHMCEPASQASLYNYDAPKFTYWSGMQAC